MKEIEILQDYKCDFELNGSMTIEPIEHKTKISLWNLKIGMVLKVI